MGGEQRLLAWLKEGGARFARLELRACADGEREVRAAKPVERGMQLLALLPEQVLTVEHTRSRPLGKKIADAVSGPDGEDNELALYLVIAEPDGPFGPYVDSLPESLQNFPQFWSDEELELLRGSQVRELALERRASLEAERDALVRAVPELDERVSAAAFARARALVLSRNFTLDSRAGKRRSLVPLADMLNHVTAFETRWTGTEEGGFVITALTDVNAGAPLHLSYGSKCNSRYLLNYGFTLDGNELDNRARVRVSAPGDPRKRRLLEIAAGAATRDFRVTARYHDPATRELFAWLRVVLADDEELALAATRPSVDPLSPRNERRVLATLEQACLASLDGYASSLDEDEHALRERGLARNRRNALVLRRDEKVVLHALARLAREAKPLLNERWAALSERPPESFGEHAGYVRAAVLPALRDDPWAALGAAERSGHRLSRIPVR